MPELIDYVRTLAEEIGPRPATTDPSTVPRSGSQPPSVLRPRDRGPRLRLLRTLLMGVRHLPRAHARVGVRRGIRPISSGPHSPSRRSSPSSSGATWTRAGVSHAHAEGPQPERDRAPRAAHPARRAAPQDRRRRALRFGARVARFRPEMVGGFPTTFGLLKWATFLTPVLILVMALPFTASLDPWLWYLTMLAAAYLLVPPSSTCTASCSCRSWPARTTTPRASRRCSASWSGSCRRPTPARSSTGSFPAGPARVRPPPRRPTSSPRAAAPLRAGRPRDHYRAARRLRVGRTRPGASPRPSRARLRHDRVRRGRRGCTARPHERDVERREAAPGSTDHASRSAEPTQRAPRPMRSRPGAGEIGAARRIGGREGHPEVADGSASRTDFDARKAGRTSARGTTSARRR